MSKLRLAIIGGGHLGRIHAKLADGNEQFEVVAVADPSPESQATVQAQLNLPVVADYRELISRIDAAIIAAPTVSHYEITSELLRAGVHCLVEKPLTSTTDQANRLVQIARRHVRVLQTGHVERFNPKWTTALPHLGMPKFIEAQRCGAYSGRSTDIGVVMDLMIHDLDLILSLDRTPIERIEASGMALLGSHEDIAETRLTFASGLVANLKASRLASAASRRMSLYTTAGYADIDFNADSLKIMRPSEDVMARLVALDELPAPQRMAEKDRIFEHYFTVETLPALGRNAILDEHNDFALSIQTGSTPAVSGEDGARAVDVATRIVDAISQHAWDGQSSRAWRIGALAMLQPRVLPMHAHRDANSHSSARRAS
ncbi:MAG: Gfo/Idh/MocA family oxidoreductase [Pirellulaceae bacterium]|nr:Gfo/Idh/MocA family oxidoreductase [Pirellulaceae bacterium]